MNALSPARFAQETYQNYVARRRAMNAAVKQALRGTKAHEACQIVHLPDSESLVLVQSELPLKERAKMWAKGEPPKAVYFKDTDEGRRVDDEILNGKIRDVKIDKTLPGVLTRVGRTKGATFVSLSKTENPAMKRHERRALVPA
jgi:hypothetical protein